VYTQPITATASALVPATTTAVTRIWFAMRPP
jgi:hypothetical protein